MQKNKGKEINFEKAVEMKTLEISQPG